MTSNTFNMINKQLNKVEKEIYDAPCHVWKKKYRKNCWKRKSKKKNQKKKNPKKEKSKKKKIF